MKLALLPVALLGATSLLAEVSAFGAGNVVSSQAYGLTSNEKALKDRLDTLNGSFLQLNSELDSTNERVEGLQSTLEGINSQYSESNTKLNEFEQNLNTLNDEFKEINAQLKATRSENKQIKEALSELSSLISAYISKDIMDENSSKSENNATNSANLNANLEQNATNLDKNATLLPVKIEEAWKSKDNASILNEAVKEFEANKLTAAKAKFEYLIDKKHKPARSNFYLGEIEYKQQNYSGAIVYYQKSVSAYSKDTDYMPKLLYHTGISFDKVGDSSRANGFYKALKSQYPDTPEAKASPDRK